MRIRYDGDSYKISYTNSSDVYIRMKIADLLVTVETSDDKEVITNDNLTVKIYDK